MSDIRMIALDLDGTTLTRSGLTRRTKETLEEAIRRGFKVVIATGRPFAALPESVLEIEGLEYVIVSNGAHLIDPSDGSFLYSDYMDRDAALEV
ncbi:MAG: HAD hydrolase family protein, partial [Firmicutes bacterium]|nr:HAD hydrolase family protein [Bacillota bacterium]